MQRQSFALGQQGPAGPRHRRSLPLRRKVLLVVLPLAVVLLIAIGLAFGLPGPSSSPTARAPAPRSGPAAGIAAPVTGAALVHHNSKRHHRDRGVIATPTPTPTPARCHPVTASGSCYKPGDFCSHADAGTTGVAGTGAKIICAKSKGWRWEAA